MIRFSQIFSPVIIVIQIITKSGLCLEHNRPAVFLQPRHFNPHPYETAANFIHPQTSSSSSLSPAPVVFPSSSTNYYFNGNNVNNNGIDIDHSIDEHPYPIVAKKRKFQVPGRFNDGHRDNENPRVYQALASYAAKVLSEPPSALGKDYTLSSLPDTKNKPATTIFGYKVVNNFGDDDFSHIQSQNSATTNGEYRVKLPDGRLQIVSYIADKNGYKADVKYTQNRQIELRNQQKIPLDYRYDATSVYQTYPKTVHDYVSPKNVQIYNNGETNSAILSTLVPFIGRSTTIAPTTVDGFSEVYPKFKFLQNEQQHYPSLYRRK